MSTKAERHAARTVVADYHAAQLAELLRHVGEGIDRYRAGELDVDEMDLVLFQYSRSAKELWKFCTLVAPEIAARVISDDLNEDWWERGAPRER